MSKLVFIYGPPASGKLTCAKELSKLTGFKVFQNHQFVKTIVDLFPYEDSSLSTVRSGLSKKLRLEIFERAAKEGVNFITTFGEAGEPYFHFFREVKHVVESNDGTVYFVQLIAKPEILLKRVESADRKATKIDSREFLKDKLQNNPHIFDIFPDVDHLQVNNSNLEPQEVGQQMLSFIKETGTA